MPSILGKLHRRLAVFQYGDNLPSAPAQPDTAALGRWIFLDAHAISSVFVRDPRRAKRYLCFLDSGFVGVVLLHEGQWITSGWLGKPTTAVPYHLPRWVRHRDCYWIVHCRTAEGFRGRGYFRRLLRHMVETVKGIEHAPLIYVDTDIDNIVSRRGILSAGFLPSGLIRTYRLWLPRTERSVIWGSWAHHELHPRLPLTKHESVDLADARHTARRSLSIQNSLPD